MTKASVTQGLVIILSLLDSVCLCMTDLVLQAVLLSVLHLSGICNKNEAAILFWEEVLSCQKHFLSCYITLNLVAIPKEPFLIQTPCKYHRHQLLPIVTDIQSNA